MVENSLEPREEVNPEKKEAPREVAKELPWERDKRIANPSVPRYEDLLTLSCMGS